MRGFRVAPLLVALASCPPPLPRFLKPPAMISTVTFAAVCPNCSGSVVITPGGERYCDACGTFCVACGVCSRVLPGRDTDFEDPSFNIHLCPEHPEMEDWTEVCTRAFATPEYNVPPPETGRAKAARDLYDASVAEVVANGDEFTRVLFTYEDDLKPGFSRWKLDRLPESVREAYGFYELAVLINDWGSVFVYQWELDGKPVFVVYVRTDGDDGWAELYDANGSPLGYARLKGSVAAWKTKGAIRTDCF
jgi:hypothetical protein